MSGYLQRLFDGQAGLRPVRSAQMSSSPLVAADQRLASPDFASNYGFTSSPDSFLPGDPSTNAQNFPGSGPGNPMDIQQSGDTGNSLFPSHLESNRRASQSNTNIQTPSRPEAVAPSNGKQGPRLTETEREGFNFPSIDNLVAPVGAASDPQRTAEVVTPDNQMETRLTDSSESDLSKMAEAKPLTTLQTPSTIAPIDERAGQDETTISSMPKAGNIEIAHDYGMENANTVRAREDYRKDQLQIDETNAKRLSRSEPDNGTKAIPRKPEVLPSTRASDETAVAKPVVQPLPDLSPPLRSELEWEKIERQITKTVDRRLEARETARDTRQNRKPPVAEKMAALTNNRPATKPTTAEAASIIGPIEMPVQRLMLFGRRMR